ncbi:hypothetical protein sos41_07130 [Alphaproteobacteria bacterium SO-S41]|nr:hypothetical protein sos41_07130 [Alphaproteobacteria bacterium SO-S41]
MSGLAILLVVVAAFTHATWNLIQKRAASAGAAFIFASCFFAALIYLPWAVWVLATGKVTYSPEVLAVIAASGVIHLAYSLSLQRGYQLSDLSIVYPVARGTGPLISSIGGFLILHEPVSVAGLTGLALVVLGIVLIATEGRLRRFATPAAALGVRWGLITGSLIAAYTVVDGYGVKVLLIQPVLLDWFANAARLAFMLPVMAPQYRRARDLMRGKWRHAVAVGALSPLGYILVLTALQMGAPLSFVAPAREMSMMVGALFGLFLLGEKAGIWRLVGCAVLLAGVVALVVGK